MKWQELGKLINQILISFPEKSRLITNIAKSIRDADRYWAAFLAQLRSLKTP